MLPGVGLLLGLAGLFVGLGAPSKADIMRAEHYKDYKKPDPRVSLLYRELMRAGYDIDAYEDAIREWDTDTWSDEGKPVWLQTSGWGKPRRPITIDFRMAATLPQRTRLADYELQILAKMCERRGIPFDGKNVF